jgi:excisionase family DNA binding protein
MNTAQAAEYLNLNDSRVRQLCRSGDLAARKVGRDWIIRKADLDRLKDDRRIPVEKRRGRPPKV